MSPAATCVLCSIVCLCVDLKVLKLLKVKPIDTMERSLTSLIECNKEAYNHASRITQCYLCRVEYFSVMIGLLKERHSFTFEQAKEFIKFSQGKPVHGYCKSYIDSTIKDWEEGQPGETEGIIPNIEIDNLTD